MKISGLRPEIQTVRIAEDRKREKKMKTNKDKLVKMSVNASVDHPRIKGYRGSFDGRARITVGTGGITWTQEIGDSCMDIAGDHIEPGVSMANPDRDQNGAVQFLSCVGNEVECLSGPAAGATGVVTGTHGGVDHTMAWFSPEDLQKMKGNENFLIRGFGQGLKVEETPDVFFMNLDPDLFEAMDLKEEDGVLEFPVAAVVPAALMGSGLGAGTIMMGDYDIMTQDKEAVREYGLDGLRFGDFVAIQDHDCEYGPHFKKGAVSVGIIVHSDSFSSGHGPGVTVLATSKEGKIRPVLSDRANLKDYLDKIERS